MSRDDQAVQGNHAVLVRARFDFANSLGHSKADAVVGTRVPRAASLPEVECNFVSRERGTPNKTQLRIVTGMTGREPMGKWGIA